MPQTLSQLMRLSYGHGTGSFSFSSEVELDGIGFGSFFCSGNEDVFGRLLPNCVVVEHIDGSPILHDIAIKRAFRNEAFLSLPEILCERIK